MPSISPATGSTEPRIRAAIAQAAGRSGIDFGYLYNQARIESSLDPQAKARTSSAAGLFQFTNQTWLHVVRAHGADHGADWAASAIERGGRGLAVADPTLRAAIADLRYDPEFASAMAAEFAADNREDLEAKLGHAVEPVDMYLAHFLGSAGAADFLTAHETTPNAAAAGLFPAAAAANRAIFYGPDGTPRSLDEIRTGFAAKLDGLPPTVTERASASIAAVPYWTQHSRAVAAASERVPLQMAAIEPIPRQLSVDYAARAYRRLAELGA